MLKFKDSDVFKKFTHKSKDKILKYIELIYSEKSELNQISDLNARKRQALKQAGIVEEPLSEALGNLTDDNINAVIYHYLSTQNSNKFFQLCSDQQLFWEMQREILSPTTGDGSENKLKDLEAKDKISLSSHKLLARINAAYAEIYKEEKEMVMAMKTIGQMQSYEQRLKKFRKEEVV